MKRVGRGEQASKQQAVTATNGISIHLPPPSIATTTAAAMPNATPRNKEERAKTPPFQSRIGIGGRRERGRRVCNPRHPSRSHPPKMREQRGRYPASLSVCSSASVHRRPPLSYSRRRRCGTIFSVLGLETKIGHTYQDIGACPAQILIMTRTKLDSNLKASFFAREGNK